MLQRLAEDDTLAEEALFVATIVQGPTKSALTFDPLDLCFFT